MKFKEFKKALQEHILDMCRGQLFVTDTDPDVLWNTYLDSFPLGTNQIFRKRRKFDCSCCRRFIKKYGNIVLIRNDGLLSIWDLTLGNFKFQPVVDAMSAYVKSKPIRNVFLTDTQHLGNDHNIELLHDNNTLYWEHLYVNVPLTKQTMIPTKLNAYLTNKQALQNSLEEISRQAIETVLDLVKSNTLYRGNQWESILEKFLDLHIVHSKMAQRKDEFCWLVSTQLDHASRIRNHSIGVLLTDLTKGVDIEKAVARYEHIVAPTNYKRPKPIYTTGMVEQARKTLTELGLLDSLSRRFANKDDITINNVIYSNKHITQDVFDSLKQSAVVTKKMDNVQELGMFEFVQSLDAVKSVELLVENRHVPNLVSLIAPQDPTHPTITQWSNNFTWIYNGNVSDSIKQNVKRLGGDVDGVLRFSIQWNESGDNNNDFDAHCVEPGSNLIYYQNAGRRHPSTGILDVDIREPRGKVAVENITWERKDKMPYGVYKFSVHNYEHRGGRTGFRAEIEFDNKIHEYVYDRELRPGETIVVAQVQYSETGFSILNSLDNAVTSRNIWGIQTHTFVPVTLISLSPNYWTTNVGNKHYFFFLDKCINPDTPNGFLNEYLRNDLTQHRRVFEALGSKMRVAPSTNQLSGLGFSSTLRNSVICRIDGKPIKLTF